MGCSCQGFQLVSACRGTVLGTAPLASSIACFASGSSAHWGHSPGVAGGVGTPGPCHLWRSQLEHLAAGRPPDAPAMLFSAPSAPASALNRRSAMPSGIVPSWSRDFLSIKNPAFWCISMRAPPAFIGSSNACHHLAAERCGIFEPTIGGGTGEWQC